jgi:LmbE family N-acetylglucosaminyl deacetylase
MNTFSRRCLALLLGFWIAAGCAAETAGEGKTVDLLVFAPHPDDEALGCAGIVRQALAGGKRVKIAVFTNGDGFPGFAGRLAGRPSDRLTPEDYLELARYRQSQSIAALKALGGSPDDLVFLGYPDSGLTPVYQARGSAPFRQKFTGRSETYGVAKRDYHTDVHGLAAPYTHASVLGDVAELIRTFRPGRICVTSPADSHPDHQAAFRFVKDGIEATGYAGIFETYLIHGGPEWPWPLGVTPQSRFEPHPVKGERVPRGVPWPPSRRVDLSPEDIRLKHAAIRAHSTHLAEATEGPLAHEKEYLESFVKSEEVFWSAGPGP